jgi:nucleotide-binding universal stress UspA family protein
MNEILVAIDFSDSSINALEHAIGVASKFRSNILMVWVESKASVQYLGLPKSGNTEEYIVNKFKKLVDKYKPLLNGMDLEYRCRKGTAYKEIIALSIENKVDMIVSGVHGAHGFRRFLMGNTANHIIAEAKCPVLTIGLHRTLGRDLNHIVLPIDQSLDTRQKVGIATQFAQLFGATIHILGLYTSSVKTLQIRVDEYVKQVNKHLIKNGINTIVYIEKNYKGAKSILDYSKKVDANLILTMIETESRTSDLWLGSQGQQLVNQSTIPVLSIANKQLIKSRPGL